MFVLLLTACLMVGVIVTAQAIVSTDELVYQEVKASFYRDRKTAPIVVEGVSYRNTRYSYDDMYLRFIPLYSGSYTFSCTVSNSGILDDNLNQVEHVGSQYSLKANQEYYIWFSYTDSYTGFFCLCYPTKSIHPKNDDYALVKNASCKDAAIEAAYCQYCDGVIDTREIAPANGHIPGEWKIEKSATCKAEGLYVQRCTVCDEIIESKPIEKQEHIPGNEQELRAASCIATGLLGVKCTECGEVLSSSELPMLEHSPGTWVEKTTANCMNRGLHIQYCTVCNRVMETEIIPQTDHQYVVQETASTCLTAGIRETICVFCKRIESTEELPLAEHEIGTGHYGYRPTCTADGINIAYCSVCSAEINREITPATGHSPMEWEIIKKNGCLSAGERIQRCSLCFEVIQTEEISALPHAWSEWTTDIEATKEMEGRNYRYCTRCGDEEYQTIPKVSKFLGIF